MSCSVILRASKYALISVLDVMPLTFCQIEAHLDESSPRKIAFALYTAGGAMLNSSIPFPNMSGTAVGMPAISHYPHLDAFGYRNALHLKFLRCGNQFSLGLVEFRKGRSVVAAVSWYISIIASPARRCPGGPRHAGG